MNTTVAPTSALASVEANISRGVRTLMAYHDVGKSDVAGTLRLSTDTLDRRMRRGGWATTEVEILAAYFTVDRNALLDDTVNPAASRLDPRAAADLSMYLRQGSDLQLLAS